MLCKHVVFLVDHIKILNILFPIISRTFTEKEILCTLQKPFSNIVQFLFCLDICVKRSSIVQSLKQAQARIHHTFFETSLFKMSGSVQGSSQCPGCDPKVYGLHSLRSGGITSVLKNDDFKVFSERLLKLHGRWKIDVAKDMYVKDAHSGHLRVALSLGL